MSTGCPSTSAHEQTRPFALRQVHEGSATHAANVHLDCAIPNFGVQEMVFFPEAVHEVMPGAPEFKDGYLLPSEAPGLGVDLDEKAAEKYPYERAYLPTVRRADGSMHDW